jgi:hypothetical protein
MACLLVLARSPGFLPVCSYASLPVCCGRLLVALHAEAPLPSAKGITQALAQHWTRPGLPTGRPPWLSVAPLLLVTQLMLSQTHFRVTVACLGGGVDQELQRDDATV